MSLENIVTVLRHAINRSLGEIEEKLLEDREAKDALIAYFSEQEVRPELTSQIKPPSLMNEYLSLTLDEKELLEGFRVENPRYLKGEGEELNLSQFRSENPKAIIKKQRYTEQLLQLFDFYLENRNEGDLFSFNHLKSSGTIREGLGNFAFNLFYRIYNGMDGGESVQEIFELASEIDPRVKTYHDRVEVLKIDGVSQLLRVFDYYLENKENSQNFSPYYFIRSKEVNEHFDKMPNRLAQNAKNNFDNGLNYLVKLAEQKRPEILDHWKYDKKLADAKRRQHKK